MHCLLLANTLTNRTLSVIKKANRVCFDFTSTLKYIYKSHLQTRPVWFAEVNGGRQILVFKHILDVKCEQTLVCESLCTSSAAN